jgi:hypothetical protein
MKKLLTNSCQSNLFTGMIALIIVGSIALGCTCGKDLDLSGKGKDKNYSTSDSPSDDTAATLPDEALIKATVRSTTADFAFAISEGDFSKLYDKASPEFRNTFSLEDFKNEFSEFTRKKKQLMPILARAVTSDPEFSSPPSIRTEKGENILVTEGKYPTKPLPYNFKYEFLKRDDSWKMIRIEINVK